MLPLGLTILLPPVGTLLPPVGTLAPPVGLFLPPVKLPAVGFVTVFESGAMSIDGLYSASGCVRGNMYW